MGGSLVLDGYEEEKSGGYLDLSDVTTVEYAEERTEEFKKSHIRRLGEATIGSAVDFTTSTMAGGMAAGWDALNYVTSSDGDNPYRDYLRRSQEEAGQQEQLEQEVDAATGMPTLLRTVAGGAGSMIPALVASAASGGAGAAIGIFAANSAAEGYDYAIENGENGAYAVAYGGLRGAITAGVAVIGGKLASKIGGALTAEEAMGAVGSRVSAALEKPVMKKLVDVTVGSLIEGGEELSEFKLIALQDYLSGLDPKALERPGGFENFLVGALVGFGANAGNLSMQHFMEKPSKQNEAEADLPGDTNRADRAEVAAAATEYAEAETTAVETATPQEPTVEEQVDVPPSEEAQTQTETQPETDQRVLSQPARDKWRGDPTAVRSWMRRVLEGKKPRPSDPDFIAEENEAASALLNDIRNAPESTGELYRGLSNAEVDKLISDNTADLSLPGGFSNDRTVADGFSGEAVLVLEPGVRAEKLFDKDGMENEYLVMGKLDVVSDEIGPNGQRIVTLRQPGIEPGVVDPASPTAPTGTQPPTDPQAAPQQEEAIPPVEEEVSLEDAVEPDTALGGDEGRQPTRNESMDAQAERMGNTAYRAEYDGTVARFEREAVEQGLVEQALDIAHEVNSMERQLTPQEHAAIGYKARDLEKEGDLLLNSGVMDVDIAVRFTEIQEQLSVMQKATAKSGSIESAAFRMRQAQRPATLTGIMTRAKGVKGAELTEKQKKKLTDPWRKRVERMEDLVREMEKENRWIADAALKAKTGTKVDIKSVYKDIKKMLTDGCQL